MNAMKTHLDGLQVGPIDPYPRHLAPLPWFHSIFLRAFSELQALTPSTHQANLKSAAKRLESPRQRAQHKRACRDAVVTFFKYLSCRPKDDRNTPMKEECPFEDVAAITDEGFRFTCPLLPAQTDVAREEFKRIWWGIEVRKASEGEESRDWGHNRAQPLLGAFPPAPCTV